MKAFLTVLGFTLILVALTDMWITLFNPGERGRLSQLLMRGVWRALHFVSHGVPSVAVTAGGATVFSVIVAWLLLLLFGWALVYWPRLPEAFVFAPGLNPEQQDNFINALYLSVVSLSTVGYGNISAQSGWLQLFTASEAIVGFVLLTVSISWVLSLYAPLGRRRQLVRQAVALQHDDVRAFEGSPRLLASTLASLTQRVVALRVDLSEHTAIYYFKEPHSERSLSESMRLLDELARRHADAADDNVRFNARLLGHALDDWSSVVRAQFLPHAGESTSDTLSAFRRDQTFEG